MNNFRSCIRLLSHIIRVRKYHIKVLYTFIKFYILARYVQPTSESFCASILYQGPEKHLLVKSVNQYPWAMVWRTIY